MNGTKKKIKTLDLERPVFEIDPETGQKILLPLDLVAIRKSLEASSSSKSTQPQTRKSIFIGKKKERKDVVDESYKMFDIDPVTGQKLLIPLNLEAMRKSLEASRSPKQKRKRNLNGPISRRTKLECKYSSEPNIGPATTQKLLRPLDLVAIRKSLEAADADSEPKKSLKQINNGRKRILTKLPLENVFGDIEDRPTKLRKTETSPCSIRKGLFSSKGAQSSKTLKTSLGRQTMPKKDTMIFSPKSSPLLNMEEIEDEIINKKGVLKENLFRSPKFCMTKCIDFKHSSSSKKMLNIPTVILEEFEDDCSPNQVIDFEPTTPDSCDEFNKLEQKCIQGALDSPITSISNLLQVTGINSNVKRTKLNFNANSDLKTAVKDVEQLIQDEQERHKRLMEEEKTRHEQNIIKLNGILTSLTNLVVGETENNENSPPKSNRRSIRLQNKSPIKDNSSKLFTSPSFSRSGDLRKSTLKKNLVAKHLDYQSPRTKKAMEHYNLLRSNNPVLLKTPKTDRKDLADTPNSMSARKRSNKLHYQYLSLLQDTPIHK